MRAMRSKVPSLLSAALSSGFDENQPLNSRRRCSTSRPLRSWRCRQSPSREAMSPGRNDDRRRGSSAMRGGRTVGGMVPGAVVARKVFSCGATPSWFFFTASTNTGCMPPSAPVLIGAIATLRRLSSANCGVVLLLFVLTRLAISSDTWNAGHFADGLNDSGLPFGDCGVEHVALLADVDLRLLARHLEMVVAFLQHPPERRCSDCCDAWPSSPRVMRNG